MKKMIGHLALVLTATGTAPALAQCPASLPSQLYEDCIIVEGAGTNFPNPGYAYQEQYLEWERQQLAKEKRGASPAGTRMSGTTPTPSQSHPVFTFSLRRYGTERRK